MTAKAVRLKEDVRGQRKECSQGGGDESLGVIIGVLIRINKSVAPRQACVFFTFT